LDNGYRYGSKKFLESLLEAKQYVGEFDFDDVDLEILSTDVGELAEYDGELVPLDLPLYEEDVELNSPKRGGPKKFYVYVKNDSGNVIKVSFGDPNLSVKFDDDNARKSFVARHKCAEKKDRTTPGYWSCNLPRYAKQLGLSGGGNFFW
jgi:hypothetical protein